MNWCYIFLLCSVLLVNISGKLVEVHHNAAHNPIYKHRTSREIRRGSRESRLHLFEEPRNPRNMLLFRNRPASPLHGLYRKGFSYLHVPDFHRRPLTEEARVPPRVNQSLDDIISGIIHLLGGDVQVTRPDTPKPTLLPRPSTKPTRINNRGPSHFYEVLSSTVSSINVTEHNNKTQSVTNFTESSKQLGTSPTRWLFPGDKDVSIILGLLNDTETELGVVKGTIHSHITSESITYPQSSSYESLIEVTPSVGSSNNLRSTLIADEGSIVEATLELSSFGGVSEASTDFLIEIQPSVTVFTSEQSTHSQTSSKSDDTERTTSEIVDATSTVSSKISSDVVTSTPVLRASTHFFTLPTGPVTDWLPVARPDGIPSPSANKTELPEPIIITKPTDFEMTVTQLMGPDRTKTRPDLPVLTRTSHTSSSTELPVATISTKVDIIYGRPTISTVNPSLPQPGRPHVFAVDISHVRPSKHPGPYQRPRPDLGPTLNNNLRPIGMGLRPTLSPQRRPPPPPPPPQFRPPPAVAQPEVRIDTCVVGDDSTCDVQLNEQCRTERGVSSCLCRAGFGRAVERGVCNPVVSMLLTLKVAKIGDRAVDPSLLIPGSQDYKRLFFEASQAMSTVFQYSPLAEAFRGASVNRLYLVANRVVINTTVHLAEAEVRGSLRHHVEHAVAASISRQRNQVGNSQLYVSGPLSALVEVEDLNECGSHELNDCSEFAICENLFGSFQCTCAPGYTDKSSGSLRSAGRICSACTPDYCNGRGKCLVVRGQQECRCRGNYGGARCQIDNEVVGVSVGVSVIAVVVIAITAACLYLWNRRWKQAQQKSNAAKHVGYSLQTLADHIRWGNAANQVTNSYVPSESTLRLAPPPPLTASAAQLYSAPTIHRQERRLVYEDDVNPYGRIMRTLQKSNNTQNPYDTLDSEGASSEEFGFPSVPSNSFIYHGTFPERSHYR